MAKKSQGNDDIEADVVEDEVSHDDDAPAEPTEISGDGDNLSFGSYSLAGDLPIDDNSSSTDDDSATDVNDYEEMTEDDAPRSKLGGDAPADGDDATGEVEVTRDEFLEAANFDDEEWFYKDN